MGNLIKESFEGITPEDWMKRTDHVICVQNDYKTKDSITETELENEKKNHYRCTWVQNES